MLTPVFMSEEEFEKGYQNSQFYVSKNFAEEYRNHEVAMRHIANIAKSYILKNWKSIADWSDLNIELIDGHTGMSYDFFNNDSIEYKEDSSESEGMQRIETLMKEYNESRHNPIREITNMVLDPTDGDFSITVNGQEIWWINDETVIELADYIEKKLETNI
jgi:hypothetical protein